MSDMKLVPAEPTDEMYEADYDCHEKAIKEGWRNTAFSDAWEATLSAASNGGKVSLSVYLDFANELSLSMDCGADLSDRPGNRSDAKRLSRLGKWDINHETYEDVMATARKLIQRIGLEVGR